MKRRFNWSWADGGRYEAGYRGKTGDCVVRALALATKLDYELVRNLVRYWNGKDRITKKRAKTGRLGPDRGMRGETIHRMMKHHGYLWTPTMFIGSGCQVHLLPDELPKVRMIVNLSHHVSYVDNREGEGIVYDTYNPDRQGTRCCYGFWSLDDIGGWKYE